MLNASGTFWLYGIICIPGFWFIFKKLPETNGKLLEEIEKELNPALSQGEEAKRKEKRIGG
jgi:hypothetical protein